MQSVYQHILIGINEMGRLVQHEYGRALRFHGFPALDDVTMKIHIKADRETVSFSPLDMYSLSLKNDVEISSHSNNTMPTNGTEEARIPVRDNAVKSADNKEFDAYNRRIYVEKFCTLYEEFARVFKDEWRRANHPDLLRELTRRGMELRGRKVFIIADLSDTASSALAGPLISSLDYVLGGERIPDINWNILGITGLDEEPVSKILSYSFLKETEFVRKSQKPVILDLKTPPMDREIDLTRRHPRVYISDAGALGPAPLKPVEIAQVNARYIFLETFYDPPHTNPPDHEFYLDSFGLGEFLFPIDEIVQRGARTDVRLMFDCLHNQEEMDESLSEEMITPLQPGKDDPARVDLPLYSNYHWDKAEPELEEFTQGVEIIEEVRNFFQKRQLEHDRKMKDLYSPDPLKHPYIRYITQTTDKMVDSNFYGYQAVKKFLGNASEDIDKSLGKVRSWNPRPPQDEDYYRQTEELKDAALSNTNFPSIVFAFMFIMVPFAKGLYDFLTWENPGGDANIYKFAIITGAFLLALAGAYLQKILMVGTLREKFKNFAACVQEFHLVHYYHTVRSVLEKFYLELLQVIKGVPRDMQEKLRPELRSREPILDSLESYFEKLKNAEFNPEIKTSDFFNAPSILDSKNKEEMDAFFSKFLDRPFDLEETPDRHRKLSVLFGQLKQGLPSWREILSNPEGGGCFFKTLYENQVKVLSGKITGLGLDMWTLIEKLPEQCFIPTASGLENISKPLIRFQDLKLREEAQVTIKERSIFIKDRGKSPKVINEYAAKKQFGIIEKSFMGDNLMFLQTTRFNQAYKLKCLDDWKYFEERVKPEEKKNLYMNDEILNAPDVNYSSRAAGGVG